jgi:hypothetical protein
MRNFSLSEVKKKIRRGFQLRKCKYNHSKNNEKITFVLSWEMDRSRLSAVSTVSENC